MGRGWKRMLKYGRWIPVDGGLYKCSECHTARKTDIGRDHFCPNCGAEMVLDWRSPEMWVSVKKRLPEADGKYIIHTHTGAVCQGHYYGREKRFSGRGIKVTHWMPFPPPPRGKAMKKLEGPTPWAK